MPLESDIDNAYAMSRTMDTILGLTKELAEPYKDKLLNRHLRDSLDRTHVRLSILRDELEEELFKRRDEKQRIDTTEQVRHAHCGNDCDVV